MTMKTIDQLNADHARAVATLTAELAVASALPVTPHRVMQTGKSIGAPWATYKVKGLRGALELIQRFNVVPVTVLRDSCASVKPAEQIAEDKQDKASGNYAAWLNVKEMQGYSASAELLFFTRIDGVGLVRVCADIEGPDYIGAYSALRPVAREERDRRTSRVIARTFSANGELYAMTDYRIVWSSGDTGPVKTSSEISYFLCADQLGDLPGAEQSHALAQLGTLSDKFEPMKEGV